MAEELITLAEVAQRLDLHVSTVRDWVRRGRIPAYGAGGRFRRVVWREVLDALAVPSAEPEERRRHSDGAARGEAAP